MLRLLLACCRYPLLTYSDVVILSHIQPIISYVGFGVQSSKVVSWNLKLLVYEKECSLLCANLSDFKIAVNFVGVITTKNYLDVNFRTRMGEQVVNMTSTLVETVSINYEDFNESFLTCGTCLCTYDGGEHTPKLLCCSHTVCLQCLSRIAASSANTQSTLSGSVVSSTANSSPSLSTTQTNTLRCPICRELIHIPRGGVPAFPPSFLVNQLLDLMASQRREVIPKCSSHPNQVCKLYR